MCLPSSKCAGRIACQFAHNVILVLFEQGRLPPWIRLPPSAALPFGASEAALAHEGNADVSADFVRAAGFGAGAGELGADERGAVRAAVLRLRAPPALRSELLSALAAEGDELGYRNAASL